MPDSGAAGILYPIAGGSQYLWVGADASCALYRTGEVGKSKRGGKFSAGCDAAHVYTGRGRAFDSLGGTASHSDSHDRYHSFNDSHRYGSDGKNIPECYQKGEEET